MRRVVIGLFVAAVFMAACGSGTGAVAVVTAAPTKTTAARTAKVAEDIQITPGTSESSNDTFPEVHADGAFDFQAHQGTFTFALAGQTIQAVLIGTVMYENVPQLSAVTGAKPWLKLDFNTIGQAVGIGGLGNLVQSQSSDPSAGLAFLRGASGAITTVGHEKVRGVDTTHYRMTVELAKAAEQSPVAQQATIRQVIDKLGIASIPVDAWIDGSGRVRRLHQLIDYSGAKLPNIPANALPRTVDVTVEYYDFGSPVSVAPPPADQVTDLSEILAQQNSGHGSGTASAATTALQARLLTGLPAGYVQQPDNVGDTGPSDLAKAVRDDGSPDARQVLTADGFVAGYQRLWAKGNDQIIDFVYEFTNPAGASSYLARSVHTALGKATPFDVTGIPGATGLASQENGVRGLVVYFTRGDFLSQVVVSGPDATPGLATSLAHQQFGLLAAG
jgi:hypothetical protein